MQQSHADRLCYGTQNALLRRMGNRVSEDSSGLHAPVLNSEISDKIFKDKLFTK
jgi:hypothetical protein